MKTEQYTQAQAAAAYIQARTTIRPRVGIILGSGLGDFAAQVRNATTIPYTEIPSFPQSTVQGHSGNLILGEISGVEVAVLQGRVHAYEGYAMAQVTFPTRVLGVLGCRRLIVTNAAGGINPAFTPGTLVAIADHINVTGTNAALGPNDERFGMRFFDMTSAYSSKLREIAQQQAALLDMKLPEGTYLAVLGPSYETPAEIRAFRTLGADLVGMSTVHEVIIARHMDMEVLGLSLVTNAAAGVTSEVIHHEEVMDVGRHAAERFTALLTSILHRLA